LKGVGNVQAILIVASATGLILGSLATAGLLCWLMWDAGKFFRHPEWVAWAILVALALSLAGKLPESEFAHLVLVFALAGGLPLWFAGRAWRRRQKQIDEEARMENARPATTRSSVRATAEPPRWAYPVITACLSEGRAPTRDEKHRLARRLWREGLEKRFESRPNRARFAEGRTLSRATEATLRGFD